MLKNRRCD